MYLLTKKYLNSVVIVDHTEKNSTYFKIYAYKHIEIMKTLYSFVRRDINEFADISTLHIICFFSLKMKNEHNNN